MGGGDGARAADARRSVLVLHGVTRRELAAAPLRLLSLPHPRHGVAARFAAVDGRVFELQRLHRRPSSWLVGGAVEHDGSLYVATPVDPLFLALPFLARASGGFSPLAQVLAAGGHPQAQALAACAGLASQLDAVCDKKAGWDDPVYRLCEAKLLVWLRAKTEQVAAALEAQGAGSGHEAALPVLSEYISEELLARLAASYGVTPAAARGEKASAAEVKAALGGTISADADTDTPLGAAGKRKAAAPAAAAGAAQRKAKKLRKIDTSQMRSLGSFFGKKKAAPAKK